LKTEMLIPFIAALLLLTAAGPAQAGERVLVVHGDRIENRWDPYLVPDPAPITPDPPRAVPASGPTVRESLDRALAKGGISEAQHARFSRIYTEARAVLRHRRTVARRCRIQLARVIGVVQTMSSRGTLNGGRMPALFLQLRRNTEFWEQEPNVRLGERVEFEDDPLVFQHYAGFGLQIQPLGSFGKANGLWKECTERPDDCKKDTLHALLESMLRVASWRAGARAWEYWFPFGGGYPPWASGMAQATGMQALARGAVFFAEPSFMIAASKALPLFLKPPPAGVRVRADHGYHYLLYSFAPGLRVLNAFLQSITGLHDYAKLNHDRRARRLFAAGDRAARRETPRYDTGRWSYYALPNKNLSTNDYHLLVIGFLENLCERTHAHVYCRTARRFTRYARKHGIYPPPPPSGVEPAPGPRCGVV
jgi:hypothetical protein